jgi:hypothetical protein
VYLAVWKETFSASKVVPCQPFKGQVYKDTRQRLRMQVWMKNSL